MVVSRAVFESGDFEARFALLTGLGNGKSPRHLQQAVEARG
jgi:hypothetical protein